MKATAVAEAMICVFSAIIDVLPPQYQRNAIAVLNAALAAGDIKDADARKVVECLVVEDETLH